MLMLMLLMLHWKSEPKHLFLVVDLYFLFRFDNQDRNEKGEDSFCLFWVVLDPVG